jgi:hypothetical protein
MMRHDKDYMELMDRYKIARRDPDKREEADLLLRAAMVLRNGGEVSENAVVGAAYL